jgi:hypothetical protein
LPQLCLEYNRIPVLAKLKEQEGNCSRFIIRLKNTKDSLREYTYFSSDTILSSPNWNLHIESIAINISM